ncbi:MULTISPECIES: HlyC/CorC family transporter [Clostridium]|uniref:Magnesium and cobalt efflux protein CorC n=2 Tax=Clostridium TaxID=1485 RepID=A0A151AKS6_9CLOT|nr:MULTISPECIES: hemolysin family protein [Clostridium]KYH28244.1 magnesium and cobalt efflux protein CorC [Clostridium colicanis DSM 13634]MBE6044320.1 HlyC/CorC family transporter [Clostridium thermopalmarium]PRR76547.1 Magnesium and cobalt efflux protein CorC [Clostridium thermopalmarium DSM 5974]PVZ28340.1 putative hemolysin [Clostridium thermopalmarium DSM 5974]
MDSDSTWQLIILLILLCSSAFFSASETALMSLSKIRIRHMVDEKVKGAQLVSKLVENPGKLLSAILIGNNVVNIGASALATSIAIDYFGEKGVGIATAMMTILVLIFGEITPKSIAARNSESISLKVSGIINIITTILNPITIIFNYLTNGIVRLLGGKVEMGKPYITEEELKTMVDVSHEEGVLEVEEKQMIYNVFEFGDSQVKDVMVPRTDMVAIEVSSTYEEIMDVFKREQFSRLPIYKETTDNIIGILHVKSLVFFDNSKEKFDINKYMIKPYFTYEYKPTTELFDEMRKNRVAMTVVLDEYGGTAGIVTMEDLVEEIVGDIEDEYDNEEHDEIQVIKEDEYIVDGSAKIELVNEMIGTNIESEDFDSIGGYVIGEIGGFPKKGETIECGNIKFIIEDIDKNRIKKLKILTLNGI